MRIQSVNAITKSAFYLHFHCKKNHSYLKRRVNARLQSYPKTDSPPISALDTIPMNSRISIGIEYHVPMHTCILPLPAQNKKKPPPVKVEAFYNKD